MELGLKGKRALVCASSRGLGFACALGLAKEGCHVVVASRNQARIEEAAERIHNETGAETGSRYFYPGTVPPADEEAFPSTAVFV